MYATEEDSMDSSREMSAAKVLSSSTQGMARRSRERIKKWPWKAEMTSPFEHLRERLESVRRMRMKGVDLTHTS